MATPRPIRSMDPYAQAFWAYTQKKEFRLQQCSRVPQISLAAGADVRPLPVRSMRMGADAGPRQSAVVDDLPSRVFP